VQSAFVGWQTSGSLGGKVPKFGKYLKQLGIELPGEKVTPEMVAADKKRAFRNAERVRQAFDGG